ncbi:Ribokinase [subsurface metagenome]
MCDKKLIEEKMAIHMKNSLSFLFIGHIAIDSIIRFKQKRKPSLGGSVTFGSLGLRTYTKSTKIGIISNLGIINFDKSLLKHFDNKSIDISGVKSFETENTNFVLDYSNHSRTLTLKSRSPNLRFEDIPEFYKTNLPNIIVLVPLCNEVSYEYVSKILVEFPNAFIGIDLQGFIRNIDDDGKISYISDEAIIANMKKIISLIGDRLILKGSEIEMKLLSGEADLQKVMEFFKKFENKAIFIMTLGEGGSMILKNGEKLLKIPAFKPKTVVDETGAGDVYLAVFIYELINSDKSWNAVESAGYIASAAASFLIEKKGPTGFETKNKVLKRIESKNYVN